MSEITKEEILNQYLDGDVIWPSTKENLKKMMDKWAEIEVSKVNIHLKNENDALYNRPFSESELFTTKEKCLKSL